MKDDLSSLIDSLSSTVYTTTDRSSFSNEVNNNDDRLSLSEEEKEDLELLKLVKDYLAIYVQKILDDPDCVIERIINKEYEQKIKILESRVNELENKLYRLEGILEVINNKIDTDILKITSSSYPYDYPSISNFL